MISMRLPIAFAVLGTAVVASAQSVLTNASYGDHVYTLLSSSDWTDAEAYAVGMGGHLATIEDAAENAWIFDTFGSFGGVSRNLWIGLNDAAQEGTFVWSSGSTSAYRNWDADQPDNAGGVEDYVHLFQAGTRFGASRWNDAPDVDFFEFTNSNVYGVVEVAPVPEPATLAALGLGALGVLRRRRRA